MQDNTPLGDYNNDPNMGALTVGKEDFGLDHYEPQFFYPLLDWLGAPTYSISLYYPVDNDFQRECFDFAASERSEKINRERDAKPFFFRSSGSPLFFSLRHLHPPAEDFFYFCHIHQFMTGRIKFVDSSGTPLYPDDVPAIPYGYETPGPYDRSCGSSGLEDYQLPNAECPDRFVCDRPGGAVGKFAECIDSMNCAMLAGMTTSVYDDNALALFSHQMIPHHQNAVNMCKSLLISGEADCADLGDEDDPACVLGAICQEIINVQNAQIQAMRGVLDAVGSQPTSDCVVLVETVEAPEPPEPKSPKKKAKTGKKKEDKKTAKRM